MKTYISKAIRPVALCVAGLLVTVPAASAFAETGMAHTNGVAVLQQPLNVEPMAQLGAGTTETDGAIATTLNHHAANAAPTSSASATIANNNAKNSPAPQSATPAAPTTHTSAASPETHGATLEKAAAVAPQSAAPAAPTPATTNGGTYGIDVATPQASMNFQEAKKEGAQFAIVKMGGANTGSPYVAPNYASQVDEAHAAGMAVGQYYLPGKGSTPKQQADFMADHLHNFDKTHGVLALDDEVLDSAGVFWNDTEAGQFFAELQAKTGIQADHLWFYVGASNGRTKGPWTNVKNLGAKIWWAAYGDETSAHTPDSQPQLGGAFPKADIHQFSDKNKVAGLTVDGDYTTEPLSQLF